MEKKALSLSMIMMLIITKAQVGIGTTFPVATFHVDGAKDNNALSSPSLAQTANDVVFTAEGNIGVGNTQPVTKLDLRSTINADNSIGVGKTTKTAAEAQAGALRYSSYNGGKLQYSDGTKWEELLSNPTKSIVVANIQAPQFSMKVPYQSNTSINNWQELNDSTNNFDPTQGVYTAPRNGIYLITFTYDFVRIPIVTNYYTEAIFMVNSNKVSKKCIKSFQNNNLQTQVGHSCTAAIQLNQGDTFRPMLYQSVYNGSLSLRTGIPASASNDDFGFINLSIMEQ